MKQYGTVNALIRECFTKISRFQLFTNVTGGRFPRDGTFYERRRGRFRCNTNERVTFNIRIVTRHFARDDPLRFTIIAGERILYKQRTGLYQGDPNVFVRRIPITIARGFSTVFRFNTSNIGPVLRRSRNSRWKRFPGFERREFRASIADVRSSFRYRTRSTCRR